MVNGSAILRLRLYAIVRPKGLGLRIFFVWIFWFLRDFKGVFGFSVFCDCPDCMKLVCSILFALPQPKMTRKGRIPKNIRSKKKT